jgi:hypothetical protein
MYIYCESTCVQAGLVTCNLPCHDEPSSDVARGENVSEHKLINNDENTLSSSPSHEGPYIMFDFYSTVCAWTSLNSRFVT